MRKVFITGGAGFVGSELAVLLSTRTDLDVTVLDNFMVKNTILPNRDNIHIMYGDIRDAAFMEYYVPKYDTVVHLAAIVGEPACIVHPQLAYDINVTGTINVINALRKDTHFIFASSSSVYGERPGELVTEDSILAPSNNYAQHKVNGEKAVQMMCKRYTILRPVTAFGTSPATRLDVLVNTLFYEALTTGKIKLYEQSLIRPIIHVHNYAQVLEWAIDEKLGENQIYNVGNSYLTMTKRELVQVVAYLCQAEIVETTATSLDVRNYDVSFDKLSNHIGYKMRGYNLRKAYDDIRHALPMLQNNPDWYNRAKSFEIFIKERNII